MLSQAAASTIGPPTIQELQSVPFSPNQTSAISASRAMKRLAIGGVDRIGSGGDAGMCGVQDAGQRCHK